MTCAVPAVSTALHYIWLSASQQLAPCRGNVVKYRTYIHDIGSQSYVRNRFLVINLVKSYFPDTPLRYIIDTHAFVAEEEEKAPVCQLEPHASDSGCPPHAHCGIIAAERPLRDRSVNG